MSCDWLLITGLSECVLQSPVYFIIIVIIFFLQEGSFISASLINLSLINELFVHEDQQGTVRVTANGEMDELHVSTTWVNVDG